MQRAFPPAQYRTHLRDWVRINEKHLLVDPDWDMQVWVWGTDEGRAWCAWIYLVAWLRMYRPHRHTNDGARRAFDQAVNVAREMRGPLIASDWAGCARLLELAEVCKDALRFHVTKLHIPTPKIEAYYEKVARALLRHEPTLTRNALRDDARLTRFFPEERLSMRRADAVLDCIFGKRPAHRPSTAPKK